MLRLFDMRLRVRIDHSSFRFLLHRGFMAWSHSLRSASELAMSR